MTAANGSKLTRLLLVDDHAAQRELVKQFLQNSRFEIVAEAKDGREAVVATERLRPDVVLLDLNMPVMNGIEALPLIRSTHPAAAVIVFSDYAKSEMWPVVQKLGAVAYVEKDMTSPILASHLGSIMEKIHLDRRPNRILLVDDDAEARQSFVDYFGAQLNVDILAVESAAQALDIVRSQPVDLIVSDHRMPGMTGLDFLREAKRIAPGVPRMMITGAADEGLEQRAIQEADIRGFLSRSNDLDALLATLRTVLRTP